MTSPLPLPHAQLDPFHAWLCGPLFADRPFSDSTISRYVRAARYFIEFCKKSALLNLDEVNAAWLRSWLYSVDIDGKSRFSASTRVVTQSALNLFYNWAQRADYAIDNPIEKLVLERAKDRKSMGRGGRTFKKLPKVLSWDEQAHLMAIVQANPRKFTAARDTAVLALALAAGLRREELCDLQAQDLSVPDGRLRITGKGSKERLVRFNPAEVAPHFEDWLSLRAERGWNAQGAFFRTGTGACMTPGLVYQQVSSYLKQLGTELEKELPSHGPHLLRHTSASAQLAKGVPVTQVQANLGLESLATLQIYAHLLPARVPESAPGY